MEFVKQLWLDRLTAERDEWESKFRLATRKRKEYRAERDALKAENERLEVEILKANDEIALGFNEFTKAITECERLRMQLERLMEAAPSLVIESSDPKYRGGQKFLLADCTELISIMNEQENSDEDHD